MLRGFLDKHPWWHLAGDLGTIGAGLTALIFIAAVKTSGESLPEWVAAHAMGGFMTGIAVLAILVAMIIVFISHPNEEYLKWLSSYGAYNTLMLQFSWYSVITIVSILSHLATGFLMGAQNQLTVNWIPPLIAATTTVWSIVGLFVCVRSLVSYGILRMKFINVIGPR